MEDDEYLEAKDSYITGKKPHHRDCNPQLQEMPVAKEMDHKRRRKEKARVVTECKLPLLCFIYCPSCSDERPTNLN